jgi:N-formylglutamate amidohydrolase
MALIQAAAQSIKKMGHSVGINWPYAGTIVPMALYQKDRRVASVMIEVNRNLYMDELAGTRTGRFETIKEQIQTVLDSIRQVHQQAEPDLQKQWRGIAGTFPME